MRLNDMIPYVLHGLAINGTTRQADLTMFVAGTSGRNSPKLVRILFPTLQGEGLIASYPEKRSIIWRLTDKGRAALADCPMEEADLTWYRAHIQTVLQGEG